MFVTSFIENWTGIFSFHELLKLPRPLSPVRPVFDATIAGTLLDVISGVSALTLNPDKGPGGKFKELLKRCFPWDEEPKGSRSNSDRIDLLYESFRNPFAHALGIGKKGEQLAIRRLGSASGNPKRGLSESELLEIETMTARPVNWHPTVDWTDKGYSLFLEGPYWGVRMMIARATECSDLMKQADKQLSAWANW